MYLMALEKVGERVLVDLYDQISTVKVLRWDLDNLVLETPTRLLGHKNCSRGGFCLRTKIVPNL